MANSYTLKQISEWNKQGSEVILPDIQRGLVWNPRQIAFLWDSMLRGFPIGGFVFSENDDDTYSLLDGQQRWNAISLGFNNLKQNEGVILWLDIGTENIPSSSTRKFFVMPTTISHPWSFHKDEDCSILSASEIREAIKSIWQYRKIDIYKEKIQLESAYPYKATFPIPLYVFLFSRFENEYSFRESIFNSIKDELPDNWKKAFWNKDNIDFLESKIPDLFKLFSRLQAYSVNVNILSKVSMFEEGKLSEENISNLEILFTRLNTMGTRITQDDLYYSAIKAYWGGIKEKIEEISNCRISPVKLISTLFRLFLTFEKRNNTEFSESLSINKIRSLAKDNEKRNQIEEFINNKAEKLVTYVDEKLNNIPKFLKIKIISENEEIYLLLLYLAYKKADIDYSGLAMFLYYFVQSPARSNLNYCINSIYSELKEIKEKTTLGYMHAFQRAISQLIAENIIWNVEGPQEFDKNSIDNYLNSEDWNLKPSWFAFWEHITNTKEFLIFAQKDYLINEFPNYNPADLKACEEHNRPWDYDHIIPRNWTQNKKGFYKKSIVDKWINKNGNFAAIPFSENRSKSDYDNWDYYRRYSDQLLFDESFTEITSDLTHDEDMAIQFSEIAFNRCINIYEKLYTRLKSFIPSKQFFSQEVSNRRKYMEQLSESFPSRGYGKYHMKFYYYSPSTEQDIEIKKDNDWNALEITFGMPICKDNYMVAFSWNINGTLEIGIRGRKNGGKSKKAVFRNYIEQNSDFDLGDEYWWFIHKECVKNKNEILATLRDLIDYMKKNNSL